MGIEGGDGSFGRYIESLKNQLFDRTITLTGHQLMDKAQTKYEELVETNKFTAGSKKEDAIVSLKAEIEALSTTIKSIKDGGGVTKNPKKGKDKKGKGKIEDWMLVPPKDGESHTKKISGDDKPWYWCPGNGAHKARWVRHKPEECKGKEDKPAEKEEKAPKSESTKEESGKKSVTWSNSMLATLRSKFDSDDE